MKLWYAVSARRNGVRVTGLTPTWSLLRRLDTLEDVRPLPTISEVGRGIYRFAFDAEAAGDTVGQIDFGPTVPDEYRWVDVELTGESGRILMPKPVEIMVTTR